MRSFKLAIRSSLTIAALSAGVNVMRATPSDAELQALRDQVAALEQQLKVISRQLEIKDETAASAAPSTPKVTANDKGFQIATADGVSWVKFRGLVQTDSRVFFGDGGGVPNNQFVLRRARLITEAQLAKNYGFQMVTDFGGSAVTVFDANMTVNVIDKALQFKVGKFKVPVGLEQLQADVSTAFAERSLVTNLVPNRDLGILASGEAWEGRLLYQAGIFNGVADGANTSNGDFDNEKEGVVRLWVSPFRNDAESTLQGLSFGVATTAGRIKSPAGRSAGYRTDGQQTFFTYSATTLADGRSWSVSPQFEYRLGSFGLLGEYVISTVNLRPAASGAKTELKNKAWQLQAGYVLTGEDSSYNGVVPRTNFDWSAGTWGAFEVVMRYANLKIDDKAFPTFASVTSSANEASSVGLGVNWYLSKAVAIKIDYFQTDFGFSPLAVGPPSTQILRQDEKAFITRFQIGF